MFPNDGKILDFEAGEDLINNQIYIIDRKTHKIMIPKNREEWIINEVVLVLDPNYGGFCNDAFPIKKGTICRCWKVWIQF